MTHAQTSAVPADLALYATMGLAAVGTMPGATVELVPYPESCRYWVRVVWPGGGTSSLSRPYAPGVLMWDLAVLLAGRDLDSRQLDWSPDWGVGASEGNPWAGAS